MDIYWTYQRRWRKRWSHTAIIRIQLGLLRHCITKREWISIMSRHTKTELKRKVTNLFGIIIKVACNNITPIRTATSDENIFSTIVVLKCLNLTSIVFSMLCFYSIAVTFGYKNFLVVASQLTWLKGRNRSTENETASYTKNDTTAFGDL